MSEAVVPQIKKLTKLTVMQIVFYVWCLLLYQLTPNMLQNNSVAIAVGIIWAFSIIILIPMIDNIIDTFIEVCQGNWVEYE